MHGAGSGRCRPQWLRYAIVLSVLALVAAGCGSRTSKAQKEEALRAGGGAGTGVAGTGGAGAEAGVAGSSTASGAATVGGGATGTAGGGAAGTAGGGAAGAAAARGGCSGGGSDTGVTPTSVTVANVSILTGPVPGLFAGAYYGTDAALAYQNSLGGVCNRQLKLLVGDDQFDCSRNRAITQDDLGKAFAFVGSFSLYDDCGAEVLKSTQVPDVHVALARGAQTEPNNFSTDPIRPGAAPGPFKWARDKYPDAVKASGSLIGDVQASRDAWAGQRATMEHLGYSFVYQRNFEPTESDFTADIIQMRQKQVTAIVLVSVDVRAGARIMSAAKQQSWRPPLVLLGGSTYDPQFVPLAGAPAVEDVYVTTPTSLYLGEDRAVNKEVDLFLTWMKKTHPDGNVDLFSVFGWTSTRLFVQALQAVGANPTRANMLAELRKVDNLDSYGMVAPAGPASKRPPNCFVMMQVKGGKYVRVDPASGFKCGDHYYFI